MTNKLNKNLKDKFSIGDVVSFLNYPETGKIVGYSTLDKLDEFYKKTANISVFETFDAPTVNTPIYLVKFPNGEKQPVAQNEIFEILVTKKTSMEVTK